LPESAPLWLVKAKLLMLQGKWGDADRALDEALSCDPEVCDAWISKGDVLLHLGNAADALAAFDRALALEPENGEARSGRERARNGWRSEYITGLLPGLLEALTALLAR
jgi:cytochrome c-type biogenesis protein CcmH/NrfG